MKLIKTIGAVALVTLLITVASARQKPAPAQPNSGAAPSGPAPELVIESFTHDFGEVKAGTPLRFAFIVKNKGTADLQITGVSPG
jgi:hypothetical protein